MTKLDLDLTDEQVASTIAQLQVPPPVPTPAPPPAPDPVPLPPADVVNPIGPKPTELSTGPRIPLVDVEIAAGTELVLPAGTYTGKNYKGMVVGKPGAGFVDCAMWGLKGQWTPPLSADHCDIGYLGVVTNNTDPTLSAFTARFCKFRGPLDNDAIRLAAATWGDNSRYLNALFEDCLLTSPFMGKAGAHFDLLQFGGGRNAMFRRCAFLYTTTYFIENEANNYVNNGTKNPGVELEDCWFDGGPVEYVLSGPMKATRAIIARSCKKAGYTTGGTVSTRPTLVNVYDDAGAPITV